MKPNFALSLSFDGIRLLHRAAGGWRIVGEVALDAADMPGELSVLRRTATALEPGGLRTKLLLPSEQIKYLTIDTKGMDNDARLEAARGALDGATPYAVDDLAFDISADGEATHVAAVARETLAEAEGFAMEHRFHPISFAGVPGENAYLGEPYFGPTKASVDLLAPGQEVEPDGIAVVVIGDVVLDTKDSDDPQQAETEATPAVEEPNVAEPKTDELEAETDEPGKEAEDTLEDIGLDDTSPNHETETAAQDSTVEDAEVDEAAASELDPQEQTQDPQADDDASSELETATVETSQEGAEHPEPAEVDGEAAPIEKANPADATTEVAAVDAPTADTAETQDDLKGDEAEEPNDTAAIPVLPSLGAASRIAPATPVVPPAPDVPAASGFSSRRGADPVPARKEPVVTAPSLPAEAVVATQSTAGIAPSAPPEFSSSPDNRPPASEPDQPAAAKTGFLSRRKSKAAANVGGAVAVPVGGKVPRSEAERLTIFGARKDVGGKPRFLGLILTAALLVFLAGVAAWASVFLDEGLSLSRLFGDRAPRVVASDPATPQTPDFAAEVDAPQVQTASLSPSLSEEDSAVLEALREPSIPVVRDLTPEQLEANYALTGIWPIAPVVPPDPAGLISLEDLYLTSIDPVSSANDAIALPQPGRFATDFALAKVNVPPAAGIKFTLDARGLVVPTLEGALSPDGFTVYRGRPDLIPPATPTRFQPVPVENTQRAALGRLRPKTRPGDLAESNERANLDGLTRNELAGLRPQLRPRSVQQQAEAAAAAAASVDTSQAVADALALEDPQTAAFVTPTRLAIKASVRPDTRPRNFARIVKRAQRTPQPETETRVATIAPRVVTPKIPSKTSVAKQATQRNAINLRKVNLIGVYGKPSNRRALVRLANGRYKKVVVGDRIDGGRVSAIGDSELRYNKSGRNVVLKMPRG